MSESHKPTSVRYAVFCGLDVGKGVHHACALDPGGTKLYDRPLPNDEAALRKVLAELSGHGRVMRWGTAQHPQVLHHRPEETRLGKVPPCPEKPGFHPRSPMKHLHPVQGSASLEGHLRSTIQAEDDASLPMGMTNIVRYDSAT